METLCVSARMPFLREHRLLLLLVTLLFAAGHAEQVLGRFLAHHHQGQYSAGHDEGEEKGDDDGDGKKDAEHKWQHASPAAVMQRTLPVAVTAKVVALVKVGAVEMPEAPVAGIDH